METTNAEPAKPATMPVTTKIPPPIIAPTLIAVALHKPKARFNALGSSSPIISHYSRTSLQLSLLLFVFPEFACVQILNLRLQQIHAKLSLVRVHISQNSRSRFSSNALHHQSPDSLLSMIRHRPLPYRSA